MHFFLPISRGSIHKKNLPSKWKNPSKPRFSGPFYILSHFPSFSLLPPNSISSGNEKKHLVSWLPRNPGFLLLFYSTWTPRGFGLVPKRNLWFPGCWENLYLKVNLFSFFLFTGAYLHVCFKKNFIHVLRFVEFNGTADLIKGNCYTLFKNHSDLVKIEYIDLFIMF